MAIKDRLQRALKQEKGIRLSPAEVVWLTSALGIEFPEPRSRNKRVKPIKGEPIDAHVRWMIRRDMPEILEIEDLCFRQPWGEHEFVRCLRQRNCIGMVAELGDRVVGTMIYELHKHRLDLVKFAVHPEFQLRTVGRQMAGSLIGKLSKQRRQRVVVICSDEWMKALCFFRAMGFKATGIHQMYFEDSDGIEMEYSILRRRRKFFHKKESSHPQSEWTDPPSDDGDDRDGDVPAECE